MVDLFPGFARRRVPTSGAEIHLRVGGDGPPVLLLHGYPQTHACWHRIASPLAERFTVVAPDLGGYGDSGVPPSDSEHRAYSKRVMAQDQVEVMRALGFERFAVVGHDRGARVAYRMALDHPERVARLVVLDIVPTAEMWRRIDKEVATAIYHWFFLIQPDGFPEAMIGHDPDDFLERLVTAWAGDRARIAPEAMAEYRRCFRRPEVIHATCEDYRAGATVDFAEDEADRAAGRRIACPVLALWGGHSFVAGERFDPMAIWRAWATDVSGGAIEGGHFLPEEAPDAVLTRLLPFLDDGTAAR